MSGKKRRKESVGPKADPAEITRAERAVGEVDKLLKRHKRRLGPKDQERVRAALDDARAAIDSGKRLRLSASVDALDTVADDVLGFARKSTTREYAESIGVAVLIAVLLRFFVLEAFKIPTGSMIPTLEVGDHIFVNKFIYGLRVPLSNESWFARWGSPERGHVIVFRYPRDMSKDYIKRVVAVAGDRVRVSGYDVWVNGEKLTHTDEREFEAPDEAGMGGPIRYSQFTSFREESSGGDYEYTVQYSNGGNPVSHFPYAAPELNGLSCPTGRSYCTVEPGFVFVMGDNRDNSQDSRVWGGVPHRLVKGRAMFIWLSWGPDGVDWSRFGKAVR